jgi:hypothetical protein
MTAFLRRATSGLAMWLGWDSATARGFGLGRPGTTWLTWSLLVPVAAPKPRAAMAYPAAPASGRVCVR